MVGNICFIYEKKQFSICQRTIDSYVFHVDVEIMGHVTQHGENNKTSEDTCATVDEGYNKRISEDKELWKRECGKHGLINLRPEDKF